MLFVQDAVVAVTGDRAKCRASWYADYLSLFQQPFVQQDVMVFPVFVHVKFEIGSFCHIHSFVACALNRFVPSQDCVTCSALQHKPIIAMPMSVISTEPMT